jgi:hypothetical protein
MIHGKSDSGQNSCSSRVWITRRLAKRMEWIDCRDRVFSAKATSSPCIRPTNLSRSDRPFRGHFTNMARFRRPRQDRANCIGPCQRRQHDLDAAIRPVHSRQHDGGARVCLPKIATGQRQSCQTKIYCRRNLSGGSQWASFPWRSGGCRSQGWK